MNNARRISYTPQSSTTPETEAATLAAVYKFVLDAIHEREKAAGMTSTNGDDTKERSVHDFRATNIMQD
ncbi:MAG: hypothetical protein LC781_09405 [Actinobacteria bacterium]|nr:hypothetical protein [Actinomycetota bacterium]